MKQSTENSARSTGSRCPAAADSRQEIFNRGVDCFNRGHLDEAAPLFERIIRMEPKNSEAHYNLGLVRYHQEAYDEAEQCFRRAVESNPANGDAQFNLGRLLVQTNRPAEAAECYLELLEHHPDDVEAHYNLGVALKDLGLLEEAIDCFRQAVKLDPEYAPAYGNLGVVLHILDRKEEAIEAYRQAGQTGGDTPSNRHILNALTGNQTDGPPDQYVSNLFDGFAPRFDENLVAMGYEIPMHLRRALDSLTDAPEHFAKAVDLGCGTGFSALPFREKVGHLTGVDLSAGMLRVAEGKEIYDALHRSDLAGFLEGSRESYDLFLMTDVCVYLGKLDKPFAAIRRRANPGALVIFSVELSEQDDFTLRSSGRYAHSRQYIERLATENSMTVVHGKAANIRQDKGEWIDGMIYILKC